MTTCPVCVDPYTATMRRPISCAPCSYAACSRCVKAYLISTPADPNCMNCHHAWTAEFLDTHLTRSWRQGEYREHRGRVLWDRERSLLPATQPAVEIERQKRAYVTEVEELGKQAAALRESLAALEAEITWRQRYIARGPEAEHQAPKERRQFIAACPSESCRGFLSTAYKCGTCGGQFCPKCRESKAEGHICDPALVATMAAIAKESRGCPSCGTAISKVSGCDQMYCTNCDTGFSWATGKVVLGVIHNPHFLERRKALGDAAQAVLRCDNGWPDWMSVYTHLPYTMTDLIRGLYQAARHVEQVVLPDLPRVDRPEDHTDLRVRYLLNELDEVGFQKAISLRETRRQRRLDIRGPLELFVILTLDFVIQAIQPKRKVTAEETTAFLEQLTAHVNEPLRAIGVRTDTQVPQIRLMSAGARRNESYYRAAGWKPGKPIAKGDAP